MTKLSENAVEKQIVSFMQDRQWRALRNHVGLFRRLQSDAKIKVGTEGYPDWTFFRKGQRFGENQMVHVEVKRPGAKPKPKQYEVMASLNHLGELSVWADSLEQFKEIYNQYFEGNNG